MGRKKICQNLFFFAFLISQYLLKKLHKLIFLFHQNRIILKKFENRKKRKSLLIKSPNKLYLMQIMALK